MTEQAHDSAIAEGSGRAQHPFAAYRRDMALRLAESPEISKKVSAFVFPPASPESRSGPPSSMKESLEY